MREIPHRLGGARVEESRGQEPERDGMASVGMAAIAPRWDANQEATLAGVISRSGIGLHSGAETQVRILPDFTGRGRYFVRMDLPDQPEIPATAAHVRSTQLSTELVQGNATVRTVEHLLAALAALGVDHARIEMSGAEVPLVDGSALPWVEEIVTVGLCPVADVTPWQLDIPLWIQQGDAFVAALPAPELRFTYGIDFELPAIGNQWQSWSPHQTPFAEAIAPARTFGLLHQIEALQAQGLIQGGSLDNALVCGSEGWLNPPLRFSNEPVRHKLLDLVGDISLVGKFPQAHFLAYKASHQLHTQLAAKLLALMNG